MSSTSSQCLHDKISLLTLNHFSQILPKTGKPLPHEWTTLSAIIQLDDFKNFKVISLATGTKCLGSSQLNHCRLSDSHAEVVAKRGAQLYFYNELKNCISDKNSVFVKDNNKFKLRPGVNFHLFISQLPCGDASIFQNSSTEQEDLNILQVEPPAKKFKINVQKNEESDKSEHRTGAKLAYGSNNYESEQSSCKFRIKPGKGDPTLSMSCSDKIGKWNILGLQGNLLTYFITQPIRLHSITIGYRVPFCKEAMQRAVFRRFEKILMDNDRESKFEIGTVEIGQSTLYNFPHIEIDEVNGEKKSPAPSTIIWKLLDSNLTSKRNVEVSVNGYKQGATKKSLGKPTSFLSVSRYKLFEEFIALYKDLDFESFTSNNIQNIKYGDAKLLNKDYCEKWKVLKNFAQGWTDKPSHLVDFNLI